MLVKKKFVTSICPPFERSNQMKWKFVYNLWREKIVAELGFEPVSQKFVVPWGLAKKMLSTTNRKRKIELSGPSCWSPRCSSELIRRWSNCLRSRLDHVVVDLLVADVVVVVLVAVVGTSRRRRSPRRWTLFGSQWRWLSRLLNTLRRPCCGCCCCDVVLMRILLSQSRWRSRLNWHLVVVVAAVGLGRLQLGCHVVVVVGLRSQSWFLTKQWTRPGSIDVWGDLWSGKEWQKSEPVNQGLFDLWDEIKQWAPWNLVWVCKKMMSQSTRGFSISEVKLIKWSSRDWSLVKKWKNKTQVTSWEKGKNWKLLGTTGIEPGLFCGHKKT